MALQVFEPRFCYHSYHGRVYGPDKHFRQHDPSNCIHCPLLLLMVRGAVYTSFPTVNAYELGVVVKSTPFFWLLNGAARIHLRRVNDGTLYCINVRKLSLKRLDFTHSNFKKGNMNVRCKL